MLVLFHEIVFVEFIHCACVDLFLYGSFVRKICVRILQKESR